MLTRRICCSLPLDTYSGGLFQKLSDAPFASFRQTVPNCPLRALQHVSEFFNLYLNASQLANQLVLLDRELLELCSQDSVGEVESAELAVVVKMLIFLLIRFLFRGDLFTHLLVFFLLQVILFSILFGHVYLSSFVPSYFII